ncbi:MULTISPECIES: transporter substrate-binding domain-containing protein [Halomonas]|uniref:Nickel transporter n=1 Tax=Halomonas litopenaei TaxID=2109328 RepID=A0ABX5IW41_9GAMM|nr:MULTISPECIES: transporter substrate-binding domain-containing protein [Halomonas]MBR9771570.1 transporter substrate-binding domain-containing protein [Gammaproteobacteria bacterium]KJZ14375.1 nickel transporter [Halomonas sp. S2151]MAR71454.1 nickel transporter [Halomonas sp.]MBR9879478.1 transporter substrate-binding domain-containing protein [Gammaproteobacteria bacterium]MCO7214332.1 transporter substrate-binding domain-containing protein [Halomonas sp. OfavH-34-E]
MNRSPLLLASALSALMIGAGPALADEPLRLAVDVPYEPFEYKTADGTLTGFEIDLGNAVCERLEIQCTWVEQPWDGMIPALMARKFDAIMSSMAITEERSRQVLFSEPYYTTPSAWITPRGRDIDIADKASLEGLSVGVQRATLQDRYVTDLYGDVLEVRRYASADDVVADLRAGRLDLTFMDYPIAEAMIDIDTEQSDFVRISDFIKEPETYFGQGVGVAFRKRDRELAERFNEALAELKSDGTYDEIMNEYFSYDVKL